MTLKQGSLCQKCLTTAALYTRQEGDSKAFESPSYLSSLHYFYLLPTLPFVTHTPSTNWLVKESNRLPGCH